MEEQDLEVHIPEITTISLPQTHRHGPFTAEPSELKDAQGEHLPSDFEEMKKHNRQKEAEFSELLTQIKGLKHLQIKKMNEVVLIQKKLGVVENNRERKR